jgi:HORMA domain
MQTVAILPEQSLSFVEIFLNAVIASVLYTRELIKHDSSVFADRCIADLLGVSGPVTYQELLDLNTQAGRSKSQAFKILLKGRSRRADKILTLLVRIRAPA